MFTDNFIKYTWIYLLRTKDEALLQFQDSKVMVKNNYNHKITAVQTDKGEKYLSKTSHAFSIKSSIYHILTCMYNSH